MSPIILQQYFSYLLGENRRIDGKKGRLSALTVVHHHRLLHRAFEDAVDWGLLSQNPIDRVKAPKAVSSVPEIMNEKEIHVFVDAARDIEYCALFYLFIYTGCRRSELLTIRWNDYDPQHGTLSIQRTLHHLHNGKTI